MRAPHCTRWWRSASSIAVMRIPQPYVTSSLVVAKANQSLVFAVQGAGEFLSQPRAAANPTSYPDLRIPALFLRVLEAKLPVFAQALFALPNKPEVSKAGEMNAATRSDPGCFGR